MTPPDQRAPRCQFLFCQVIIGHRDDVTSLRRSSMSVLKGRVRMHHQPQVIQRHWEEAPHQFVVLPCSAHHGVGLSTVSYTRVTESLLRHAHLHGKIWPALFRQPLDCAATLPKAPHFRSRGLVLWLGSCSNGHLVDFQSVVTPRNSDLFGEDVLGNVATTELSLIFPFAEGET